MSSGEPLLRALMALVPMILSLTVHEFSHAAMARSLGDDTAERMGRLNLNPMSHIDPIGTIALPLILTVFGAPPFGWAKPVPFNPARFRRDVNMRTGAMLVAFAGPFSNLILAVICGGLLAVVGHNAAAPIVMLITSMIWVNIGLAVFNMIPVHPLDGQKVLTGLLPINAAMDFERFNHRYGVMLLVGVLFVTRQTGVLEVPILFLCRGIESLFGVRLI
jgi:Zn-dependent protease